MVAVDVAFIGVFEVIPAFFGFIEIPVVMFRGAGQDFGVVAFRLQFLHGPGLPVCAE